MNTGDEAVTPSNKPTTATGTPDKSIPTAPPAVEQDSPPQLCTAIAKMTRTQKTKQRKQQRHAKAKN
jgi:hypothetical protein